MGILRSSHPSHLLLPVLGLCLAAGLVLPKPGEATLEPIAVIVSPRVKATNIDMRTLRRAFRGEPTTLATGERLIPFNHPVKNQWRVRFDRTVLSLEPAEIGRYWVDRRIRGGGKPPRNVPSSALLIRVVQRMLGAIAYMPLGQVGDSVRVLRVNGKTPGQAGYPLR